MNCSDSFSLCSNLFLVGGLVVFSSPMLGSWNGGRLRVGMGILYVCSSAEDQATGMQLVGGLLEGLLHGRPAKRLCGLPSCSLSSYTTVHALNTSHTMTTCLLLRELFFFFSPFFCCTEKWFVSLEWLTNQSGFDAFWNMYNKSKTVVKVKPCTNPTHPPKSALYLS